MKVPQSLILRDRGNKMPDLHHVNYLKNIHRTLGVVVNSEEIQGLPIYIEFNHETDVVKFTLPELGTLGLEGFASATGDAYEFASTTAKNVFNYEESKEGEVLSENLLINEQIRSGKNPNTYIDILKVLKGEFKQAGYTLTPKTKED